MLGVNFLITVSVIGFLTDFIVPKPILDAILPKPCFEKIFAKLALLRNAVGLAKLLKKLAPDARLPRPPIPVYNNAALPIGDLKTFLAARVTFLTSLPRPYICLPISSI